MWIYYNHNKVMISVQNIEVFFGNSSKRYLYVKMANIIIE